VDAQFDCQARLAFMGDDWQQRWWPAEGGRLTQWTFDDRVGLMK